MSEINVHRLPEREIEKRRQKKRKRRLRRRIILIFLLAVGVMIGILFTPLFTLDKVVLNGNEKITYEQILETGNITTGKNLFTLNLNEIGDELSKIPYVNSINITRKLPDKLVITLTECIPLGYVPMASGYAVIDKDGKVLELSNDTGLYKIPVISDYLSDSAIPSEKISVEEQEKFKKTLEILRDLYNNNFIENIYSMSMSGNEIVFKISDRLIIEMGEYEQFNAKIVMVKEILSKLPENDYGTLRVVSSERVYHDHVMPEGATLTEEELAELEKSKENKELNLADGPALDENIYQ